MSGSDKIRTLRNLARRGSLEDFQSKVVNPLLLIESAAEVPEGQRFTTLKGELNHLELYEDLLELRKVEGRNAFSTMVTVGRAANNDLILEAGGVSKFHAYFLELEPGWALVDAGSSFGTSLNHRELEPRVERATLQDHDTIRFGNAVTARFLSPEACYEFLRESVGSGSGSWPAL